MAKKQVGQVGQKAAEAQTQEQLKSRSASALEAKKAKEAEMSKEEELQFEPFHFPCVLGISPQCYLPIAYGVLCLLLLYYLFLDQGLRKPQVQLEFFAVSGEASLYVNDKFHSNLLFSPKQHQRSVLLPAGQMELRIEKEGMRSWRQKAHFSANIWNNRWNPQRYVFQVKMTKSEQFAADYFWQEAWRAYLYRGLEGQKEISFDASHPYPWGLSEALRAHFYSENLETSLSQRPRYWSADIQRGIASTTNFYQWGDLLSAYSLATQFAAQDLSTRGREQGHVELLGPRSLAVLARSAVKRLQRLEPGTDSLEASWQKGLREGFIQLEKQSFTSLGSLAALASPVEEEELATSGVRSAVELSFADFRFMAVPGSNFAVQQQLVSNEQFARFWFSDYGRSWRKERERAEEQVQSLSQSVLYEQDLQEAAWDWPPAESLSEWQRSSTLEGQAVRGITWLEAQAFAMWLQEEMPQAGWVFSLPSRRQYEDLLEKLAALESSQDRQAIVNLDFSIPIQPPAFAQQASDALGIQGLGAVLWQWLDSDYLPYRSSPARLGSSDLHYKVVAGGSWINALPIDQNTEDLWANEFLRDDNELPLPADRETLGGQFTGLRSPYTGFRLVAKEVAKRQKGTSEPQGL